MKFGGSDVATRRRMRCPWHLGKRVEAGGNFSVRFLEKDVVYKTNGVFVRGPALLPAPPP